VQTSLHCSHSIIVINAGKGGSYVKGNRGESWSFEGRDVSKFQDSYVKCGYFLSEMQALCTGLVVNKHMLGLYRYALAVPERK
jgi:hypothetical protein